MRLKSGVQGRPSLIPGFGGLGLAALVCNSLHFFARFGVVA